MGLHFGMGLGATLVGSGSSTPVTITDVDEGTYSGGAQNITITAPLAQNGDGVYVVLEPSGDTAPNATEVRNGQASGGGSPTDSGSGTWSDGSFSLSLSGGITNGSYILYVVIDNGALSNVGVSGAFTVDTVDPVLSSVSATDDAAEGIDWAFTPDEDVTYRVSYWPDGTDPSDAAIESGTGSIATSTGSATASVAETGNFASTGAGTFQPTIYVEDAYGNKTHTTVADVTVAAGSGEYTDDFDQADSTVLENESEYTGYGTWSANITADSGTAGFQTAGNFSGGLHYNDAGIGADQLCQFKLRDFGVTTSANLHAQGVVRATSASDGYRLSVLFRASQSPILRLYKGGSILSATVAGTIAVGDEFRVKAIGTTISVDRKPSGGSWGEIYSTTDSDYTDGDPGIYLEIGTTATTVPLFEYATFGEAS